LKNSRNNAATIVALFLMFAMALSLVSLPNASAQGTAATFPYLGAVPNPVGVGQEVLLHVGITKELQSAEMGWEGLSVTITKPDGTTQTLRDITTDSTGGTGRVIVPDQPGNWTLQAHFPEQEVTTTKRAGGFFTPLLPIGTIMLASSTEPLTLVVQEDPVPFYPDLPLPAEYWTRTIDPQLRSWHTIAGNWIDTPRNYYAIGNEDAPETAHILWSKVLTQGGLVGEPLGQQSFEMGDAYEGYFSSRIALGGRLYYNKYAGPSAGVVDIYREYVCVDIRTGEELWSKVFGDHMTLARGQLMYWDTYDYHGVYDYLWFTVGSTWVAYDAYTGDWVYNMTNVPSGTLRYGPKGEFLIYTFNQANGWMTMWNSSNIPALYSSQAWQSMGWGQWRPYGKVIDAQANHAVTFAGQPFNPSTLPTERTGYQWNKTIPTGLAGSVTEVFVDDRVVGGAISTSEVTLWGLSLVPGDEGRLLFNRANPAPAYWAAGNLTVSGAASGWAAFSLEDKVAVTWIRESREHFGWSLEDGRYLWGPTEPQYYLDSVEDSPADVRNIAYGKLLVASVSGIVYAYDVQTGERAWTYEATDPYGEYLFATTWWMKQVAIADGKLYVGHTEHSPLDPRPRGAPMICLDVETGEEIWRINGAFRNTRWGGRGIIADSVLIIRDTYDNVIYAIGKGPSAITVDASPEVSIHGSNVLVKGMVTDISPGTNAPGLTMRFPKGVPAVADESMSEWMLYVYKQFPRPADAVGVEVVISVLDPNNNAYEVGRTTAHADGTFGLAFEPEVPGTYKVTATFEGSKSYWGTSASTYIDVAEAPPLAPEATPPPASLADIYFLPVSIALLIAIIVVGVVLALMLRKR
jgi:hypothetical protein